MISFHPDNGEPYDARRYWQGFQSVDTDDPNRIAKCMTKFIWSPIKWVDGSRKEANFELCNWLVFDFDTPEMTLAEAQNAFCDCIHVIGTTRNHQKEKNGIVCDRFRVAMIFARAITDLRVYRYTMHKLMENYPVDRACKDGARFFFPCKEIISVQTEGFSADLYEQVPENFERYNPKKWDTYRDNGVMPPMVAWFLRTKVPEGQRNKEAFKVACDLLDYGMEGEEIFSLLARSPTYEGRMDAKIEKELHGTVTSAGRRKHQHITGIANRKEQQNR